jgi:hypothetical protein
MDQADSYRPLTAEAWFRDQFSACGICGGQSGTGTVFLWILQFFAVSVIPSWVSILTNNRPVGGRSSETSLYIDMNKQPTNRLCD